MNFFDQNLRKTLLVLYMIIILNSRNQHRLIVMICQHVLVCSVNNGENMGRHLRAPLSSVQLDDFISINR